MAEREARIRSGERRQDQVRREETGSGQERGDRIRSGERRQDQVRREETDVSVFGCFICCFMIVLMLNCSLLFLLFVYRLWR